MKVGYARTSTLKQEAGLAAQLRVLLEREGCDEIFQEQVSSVEPRSQFEAALRLLRSGDVLVVTKLDRAFRSLEHAISVERQIATKGATLKILDPAIDTSTPIGRMLFGMLASVAQFEREIMLERQREGIAKAQAEGKYRGRQPTARAFMGEIAALATEGHGATEIGRQLTAAGRRISQRSVERLLAEIRQQQRAPAT